MEYQMASLFIYFYQNHPENTKFKLLWRLSLPVGVSVLHTELQRGLNVEEIFLSSSTLKKCFFFYSLNTEDDNTARGM